MSEITQWSWVNIVPLLRSNKTQYCGGNGSLDILHCSIQYFTTLHCNFVVYMYLNIYQWQIC